MDKVKFDTKQSTVQAIICPRLKPPENHRTTKEQTQVPEKQKYSLAIVILVFFFLLVFNDVLLIAWLGNSKSNDLTQI